MLHTCWQVHVGKYIMVHTYVPTDYYETGTAPATAYSALPDTASYGEAF